MTLRDLIEIRDALLIAKQYADSTNGKKSAPSEVYMPIFCAWSRADAIVTVKSRQIEVEVTE